MASVPDRLDALEAAVTALQTQAAHAEQLAFNADERTTLCEKAVTQLAHDSAGGQVGRGVGLPVFGKKP